MREHSRPGALLSCLGDSGPRPDNVPEVLERGFECAFQRLRLDSNDIRCVCRGREPGQQVDRSSQPIFAPLVEGKRPFDPDTPGIVVWRAVTPDYFRTLGIPILRGRAFNDDDRRPNERSIILSASYARTLFGDENPLGKRFCRFPVTGPNQAIWYTIVGVAADARNVGLSDRNDPEYYLMRRRGSTEYADIPMANSIMAHGAPGAAAALRREIAALDPSLPAVVGPFDEHIGELAAYSRLQSWVLTLFGFIGVLLAGFGLYGLVSFLVVQRKPEFGVRLALEPRAAISPFSSWATRSTGPPAASSADSPARSPPRAASAAYSYTSRPRVLWPTFPQRS